MCAMSTDHTEDGSVPAGVVLRTRPSDIGELVLAASDRALVYCGFDGPEAVRARLARAGCEERDGAPPAHTALLDRADAEIDAYLAGTARTFTVPVDLRLATPFCRQVVRTLDDFVPYGTLTTYGEYATRMGRAGAARPVGTALGANPLCVVLPCHRVVGAGGRLTGYAGGLPAKQFLLALEGTG